MSRVGVFGRVVSRQAAHPTGLLGRIIGRIWVWETAVVNDAVLAAVDPHPGETILEIGHGPGRTLQRIVQAGAGAVGVEVSQTMSRQAHRRNRKAVADGRLRLLVGDGTKLPVTDQSVDVVVAVHTISFWPDPQTTLAECLRVLRPGGRLVIASRDGAAPLPRRLDPAVYSLPTIGELSSWMTDVGLDVTTRQSVGDVLIVAATPAIRKESNT
ncbi:MAG: class I SAM-dependent methyltransferase [Acidimicrobiia bacterium]|nr:class I SAM-dependent methyltransferase [Acidimicrobiia bacterium]